MTPIYYDPDAYPNLCEAHDLSDATITKLRSELAQRISTKAVSVVTVGSFARHEASNQSDLDFFLICEEKDDDAENARKEVEQCVKEMQIAMPSSDGHFGEMLCHSELMSNIGGGDDSTKALTRRVLMLLESKWLFNEHFYASIFDELIRRYVSDKITQHQLCRFLLNELIRYYRTIAVDFEYKTVEAGKPWGDRNIKLMFSRKLIYFSGILTVAETVQHTPTRKRAILLDRLMQTPLERLAEICSGKAGRALEMYDHYLGSMASPEVRAILRRTNMDRDSHSDEFRDLKNQGHHFSWELMRLLIDTYPASHPIHHAVVF